MFSGHIQCADHGRVLRVAAGKQAAVRRTQGEAGLPAGRSGGDQQRRHPRAAADQGPQGPGRDQLAEAAGQALRRRPGRRQSGRLRPGRAGDAGAAVPLARRARTAGRGGEIRQTLHVDHEHAAAAVSEAHPWPEHRLAAPLLHRRQRVGEFRPWLSDAVQPGPAGDPHAGRQDQRADGDAADQLQGGALRFRGIHQHPAPDAAGDRGDPLRRRRWQRSTCR